MLVNFDISDLNSAVAAVENLRRSDHPFFETRRGSDDLERRSRLVDVLHSPIAPSRRREIAKMIRVKRRHRGHGQNGAVVGIHHNRRSAGGVPLRDRFRQRALGDELDDRVDRQQHIVAVDRPIGSFATDQIHSAASIAQQGDFTRAASNDGIERMLDATETLSVNADVADDIGRERSFRIRPAMLIEKINARQMKSADRIARFERKLTGNPHERAARCQLLFDLVFGHVDRRDFRQRARSRGRIGDGLRIGVQGNRRDAFRENAAASVENRAAHRLE